MGDKLTRGKKAVALPGKVTLSFLPHTPHAKLLADQAHASGKEVMLHLPMETESGRHLGPGGLTLHMTEGEIKTTTNKAVDSVPHVKGINNHMGSLLTRHPGAMEWFVQAVKEHDGLYFVDSRTSVHTVARQVAEENGLPSVNRDVFLDHVQNRKAIRKEFRRLLKLAKKQGFAVGIGHPHPETLAVLKSELSKLDAKGIRLVPVSQIIKLQQGSYPKQEHPTKSQLVAKRLQGKR
jgi:polysaccharide deacetylase 2 family uncharacterized protein YibQ